MASTYTIWGIACCIQCLLRNRSTKSYLDYLGPGDLDGLSSFTDQHLKFWYGWWFKHPATASYSWRLPIIFARFWFQKTQLVRKNLKLSTFTIHEWLINESMVCMYSITVYNSFCKDLPVFIFFSKAKFGDSPHFVGFYFFKWINPCRSASCASLLCAFTAAAKAPEEVGARASKTIPSILTPQK